jgi:hypothetical protein
MEITLPQIVLADDYHEFASHGAMATLLKDLNPQLKLAEVGFIESKYLGVIYTGRRPARAKILEMIKNRFGKDLSDMYIEVDGKQYLPVKNAWTVMC